MHVSIDVSPAVNGKAGLGRYALSLAEALHTAYPHQTHMFANIAEALPFPPELAAAPRTTVQVGYKPWRLAVLTGQFLTMRFDRLLPKEIDLFHSTEHLLFPTRRIPVVLTVHDLIYKLFPEYHKRLNYWYLNIAMPVFVKRAEHIIAVSESTKADVVQHYQVNPSKITVIYEAAAPHFVPQSAEKIAAVRESYALPKQYIVTVGTIEPRKNLARLVETLRRLRAQWPDLHLVVVGSDGWLTDYFYQAVERTGMQAYIIQPGFIPDDDLPAVIAGAQCAVTPSLYEGFGLPVLEAMAVGVPVACSNTGSLSEVAGEAANLFDPTRTDAIVEAVAAVLSDKGRAAAMRQAGLAQASRFSWERTATETWQVYQFVLQQNTATGQ